MFDTNKHKTLTIYHLKRQYRFAGLAGTTSPTITDRAKSGDVDRVTLGHKSVYIILDDAIAKKRHHPSDQWGNKIHIDVLMQILDIKDRRTIKAWAKGGNFKITKSGGANFIDKLSFEAWINREYQEQHDGHHRPKTPTKTNPKPDLKRGDQNLGQPHLPGLD